MRTAAALDLVPPDDARPAIDVRDLTIRVTGGDGVADVVSNLSFSVARGRSLGIVGESGSGKSMTAMAIAGLLPRAAHVASGSIRVAGTEVVGCDRARLRELRGRGLGMVFQDPMTALNPAFTVGEQIAERLRYVRHESRREAWNHAIDLLGTVGIPDPRRRAGDYPHEFSGGMRQRVVIAIAISCEPALLIADEPTTALDVTIQAQILRLFERLRDELGLALVFISHDLAVVETVCDDVLVMYAGHEVEQGRCADVLQRATHPYSRALLAAVPDADEYQEELVVVPGAPPTPWTMPRGCRFAPRCGLANDSTCLQPVPIFVVPDGRRVRCVLAQEAGDGR